MKILPLLWLGLYCCSCIMPWGRLHK